MTSILEKGGGTFAGIKLLLCENPLRLLDEAVAAAGAELPRSNYTWVAAAAHESPQELGDFGALVHGGWHPRRALLANFLSGLMFPVGALLTYTLALRINTGFLIAFGAGNFRYIGASDLVPEVNKARTAAENVRRFAAFAAGLIILLAVRLAGEP